MTHVAQVQRQIHKLRKAVAGRPFLLHSEIAELFDRHFKKFGARTEIHPIPKNKNFISVGGEFLIGRVRQPIVLQVAVSSHTDRVKVTKRGFEGVLFLLYQILLHELRHKYQYLFRDDDCQTMYIPLDDGAEMTEEQEYLAEMDEIDAYAGDIALELFFHCPKTWQEEMSQITHKKIQSYHYYLEIFAGTEWSDIRHQLMKKVYKHVLTIEATKGWFKYA